ncbi:MAG TPA: hypothetical protein VMN39_12725 [Longimicrobiaceae bacterium]|nr:hypothetical protein [Longimicrobiaceae bacterium]
MTTQTALAAGGVTVREIPPGKSLEPFIDLAWRLNADDPNWVAPLRMSVATALNRGKHPFRQHAEVAYFVAERDGAGLVGRIAAIENRLHNEFHGDRVGFFGLFESENRRETAEALFDAAATWLRGRGMRSVRGPMNFSTNDEVASPGVLVEGFETRPYFMMGHNPRYYAALLEGAGFEKANDLVAFYLDDPEALPRRWVENFDRVLQRQGATLRTVDLRRFRDDVAAIKEIYNAAWSKNWGFVPMTDAEFEHLAKEFRPVIDPELCLIAEVDGEPIGFSLALPDLNEVFHRIPSGRLLPLGALKILWYRRKIKGIRVMTAGFKPRFQHAGLGPALYLRTWLNGVKLGYVKGETSWILEGNHEMIRALERIGGHPYKRYRVYDREIAPSA